MKPNKSLNNFEKIKQLEWKDLLKIVQSTSGDLCLGRVVTGQTLHILSFVIESVIIFMKLCDKIIWWASFSSNM